MDCEWKLIEDEAWQGTCGIAWILVDGGTPADHHMHFCPHCGRPLLVVVDSIPFDLQNEDEEE